MQVREYHTAKRYIAGYRMELCKEDGTVLKAVIMDECEGAPHEFRGVYRGGLLRTLQSGVPSDCIQYNSAVQSVVQDEDGEPVMPQHPPKLLLRQNLMPASRRQCPRESNPKP